MQADDNSKVLLADILGVPVANNWEIINQLDNLYMVHATTSSCHLRGEIVDLQRGTVIVPAYPTMNTVVADRLTIQDGKLRLRDDTDTTNEFDVSDLYVRRGYEGTVLRLWNDGQKVHLSTHKRIDCSDSRWVVTSTFQEMFNDLNGPMNMFDDPTVPSNAVFYFLVVHPEVQVVSSRDIGEGLLVYLDGLNVPSSIDRKLRDRYPQSDNLSIEEANKILYGGKASSWMEDDFLVVSTLNGRNPVKVCSKAYMKRSAIRNDNPNVVNMLYKLITDAVEPLYNDETKRREFLDKYSKKYPTVMSVKIETIEEMVRSNTLSLDINPWGANELLSQSARLHNTFLYVLGSVSQSCRSEVLEAYKQFFRVRMFIANWIQDFYSKRVDVTKVGLEAHTAKRIQQIIYQAEKHAKGSRNGKRVEENAMANIASLINSEKGDSLYKLKKAMEQSIQRNRNNSV